MLFQTCVTLFFFVELKIKYLKVFSLRKIMFLIHNESQGSLFFVPYFVYHRSQSIIK